MLTTLIVCFCLATNLHAEHSIISSSSPTSISTSTNAAPVNSSNLSAVSNAASSTPSPPSLFIIDDELAKIAASCFNFLENEQLSGNQFIWRNARIVNEHLMSQAVAMIGLEELRAALGFAPPGNWTKHRQPPSEEELAAAPSVEAYYELREPRSQDRSLDSEYFFEHNFPPVIAFLDKRFPTIRKIFRRKFEESLGAGGSIDRTVVDHMIDEYLAILDRVHHAVYNVYWSTSRRLNDSN